MPVGVTLLIRHPGVTWHEWMKTQKRDHIVLDPTDASHGCAGRLMLLKGGKPAMVRFYGSLDPQRSPHVLLAALHEMLAVATDPIVEAPAYRATPVLRQTLQLIASVAKPDEILVAKDTPIDRGGWRVGPEEVDLQAVFPKVVLDAQRKAQWLALLERCHQHELILGELTFEGTRLGSGTVLHEEMREKAGLAEALHAEVCGNSLLVVADHEIEESRMGRALDVTHATRATVVMSQEYENLLCAMMRESGEEIGHGMVDRIDFKAGIVHVRADAVPPVPVRVLKLGSLKVDRNGKELGELRPWQA